MPLSGHIFSLGSHCSDSLSLRSLSLCVPTSAHFPIYCFPCFHSLAVFVLSPVSFSFFQFYFSPGICSFFEYFLFFSPTSILQVFFLYLSRFFLALRSPSLSLSRFSFSGFFFFQDYLISLSLNYLCVFFQVHYLRFLIFLDFLVSRNSPFLRVLFFCEFSLYRFSPSEFFLPLSLRFVFLSRFFLTLGFVSISLGSRCLDSSSLESLSFPQLSIFVPPSSSIPDFPDFPSISGFAVSPVPRRFSFSLGIRSFLKYILSPSILFLGFLPPDFLSLSFFRRFLGPSFVLDSLSSF